uniref:Uncharacterized protein n=1 Tax=Cacopsylla melanoneura TaxID=428564 RepID=A0A8D8X4L3_9HEMI
MFVLQSMNYFPLLLLLLTCVHISKTHDHHHDSQRMLELKREKRIMEEPAALMNEDTCEVSLDRMRREVSNTDNMFHETRWNTTLEQDGNNVQQFPLEYMRLGGNTVQGDSWRSLTEIKSRRRRGNWPAWPEWRRKQRSEEMKKYWKYHIEENTTRIINQIKQKKDYWAQMSDKGGDRRQEHAEFLKAYWKAMKEEGKTHKPVDYKQLSVKLKAFYKDPVKRKQMSDRYRAYYQKRKEEGKLDDRDLNIGLGLKNYWKKQKEGGNTERLKQLREQMALVNERNRAPERRKENSERMIAWWKKMKEDGKTDVAVKIRGAVRKYWEQANWRSERSQQFKGLSERMKAYWVKLKESGKFEERIKKQIDRLKKSRENPEKRKEHAEKMKKYWVKFKQSEGYQERRKEMSERLKKSLQTPERRKKLSESMKQYWIKLKERGGLEERHRKMGEKMKKYMADPARRKHLSKKAKANWAKRKEKPVNETVATDNLQNREETRKTSK